MQTRGVGVIGIDEDVHLPSADEALLLGEVVVQVVVGEGGAPGLEGQPGLAERILFVAAAADGAERAAVLEDEHPGADALRRRALRADDGDQRHRLAARECLVDGPNRLGITSGSRPCPWS